ncbi:MAG: hypothetical protein PHF84_00275 [bacterium]|nr:hypothetical protein [bacterium]
MGIGKGIRVLGLLLLGGGLGPLQAVYQIDYILNLGSLSIGQIRLVHYSNHVTARVRITASGLIDFQQEDRCSWQTGMDSLRDDIRTSSGNKLSYENIVFLSNVVGYVRYSGFQTNRQDYTNRNKSNSLLAFVHSFIAKVLPDKPSHTLFLNGKFSDITLCPLGTNQLMVMDRNEKYEIGVTFRKQDAFYIPERVDLKKYMMYGINWNMFNCTLKDFKIK